MLKSFLICVIHEIYVVLCEQDSELENNIVMSISESIPADLSKRHRRKSSRTPSMAISRTSLTSGELSITDILMYL